MSGDNGQGEKKEKHYTIDDLISEIQAQPSHDLSKNLKAYDKHMSPDNQQRIFNKVLAPAIDDFYNALKEQLDHAFAGKDEAKIKGKFPEVKKAVVEAFKKFFEKAMPSVLDAIKDMKSVDDQYTALAHFYDLHILGVESQQDAQALAEKGILSMQAYTQALEKSPDATAGSIKEHLYMQKGLHARQGRETLNEVAVMHYIRRTPAHKLAAHIKPEVEKTHTIDDKVKYVTLGHSQLLKLRDLITSKGDKDYAEYGIKLKGGEPAAKANGGGGGGHP